MGIRTVCCAVVAMTLGLVAPRAARAEEPAENPIDDPIAGPVDDRINAVIGDVSLTARGVDPAGVDETTRIRAHLDHVLAGLRARDVSALPAEVVARRRAALTALAGYIERGRFPRRTDDGYPGRRPRFIDDRGVHCAVGYLMAASGAERLARAIDAEHEYAYVRDLRVPAVAAWAADHGFTLDELATIQPEYHEPPPGPERTRELIFHASDRIALRCARRAPHVARVAVRVRGDRRGAVSATTTTPGEFAACVAETVGELERPERGRYRPYTFDLELRLTAPEVLLDRTIAGISVPTDCAPRPGALARTATIEATSDLGGLTVRVTTEPSNPEIDACVQRAATDRLGGFGAGVWSLRARHTAPVPRRFTDARLTSSLELAGPTYATRCYPERDPPAELAITVRAAPDDPDLTIELVGGNRAFRTCVRDLLRPYLRQVYGTTRTVGAGRQPYFRVDAAVHASVRFAVRPPDPPRRR